MDAKPFVSAQKKRLGKGWKARLLLKSDWNQPAWFNPYLPDCFSLSLVFGSPWSFRWFRHGRRCNKEKDFSWTTHNPISNRRFGRPDCERAEPKVRWETKVSDNENVSPWTTSENRHLLVIQTSVYTTEQRIIYSDSQSQLCLFSALYPVHGRERQWLCEKPRRHGIPMRVDGRQITTLFHLDC